MKDMYFLFDEYKFYNKLNKLIDYLKENELEYFIKDDYIEFYTKYNDRSITWIGNIYKDRIYSLNGTFKSDDKTDIYRLYDFISCKYSRKYIDVETKITYFTKIPTKTNFIIEISVSTEKDFIVNVLFEDDKHKPFKNKQKIEDIKDSIGLGICGIGGTGLSVLFILLYINRNNLSFTIISGIVSYLFMMVSIFIYNIRNHNNIKKNILYSIILPIVYIGIVFCILIFFMSKKISADKSVLIDCLMYAIYTMPAFILVICILFLAMICLSYA